MLGDPALGTAVARTCHCAGDACLGERAWRICGRADYDWRVRRVDADSRRAFDVACGGGGDMPESFHLVSLEGSCACLVAPAHPHYRVGSDADLGQRRLLWISNRICRRDPGDRDGMETALVARRGVAGHGARVGHAGAHRDRGLSAPATRTIFRVGGAGICGTLSGALAGADRNRHGVVREPSDSGGVEVPAIRVVGARGAAEFLSRRRGGDAGPSRGRGEPRGAVSLGAATPRGGWHPRSRCQWTGATRRRTPRRRSR